MIKLGFIQIEIKNIPALISAITGIAGLFVFQVYLGIITILLGLVAKKLKTPNWSWAIMLGIGDIILYLINSFLV